MMNKNEILADLLGGPSWITAPDGLADILAEQERSNWLVRQLKKPKEVYDTLKEYKKQMDGFREFARDKNYLTPGIDKYYHTAGMYDAVQGDIVKALAAVGMGAAKEMADFVKYSFAKNPVYAAKESWKDIKNNTNGIYQSFLSDKPAKENPKIKQLQTPTMIDIMPMYEALKNENR